MNVTKTTSLQRLTEALTEHDWTFEVVEQDVRVPDPDKAVYRSSYSSRASYVPKKSVPGVVVTAKNGREDKGSYESKSFTAHFTADGKYVGVSGHYPFADSKMSLTKVVEQVRVYSPTRLAEQEESRAAERKARMEAEAAEVKEAYDKAVQAEADAGAALSRRLTALGLTDFQRREVTAMLLDKEGVASTLLGARYHRDRVGKGWLPGKGSVSGRYVDGVLVEGTWF